MQGVVKAYDPTTKTGVLMSDRDRSEIELAPNALEGSIFRMLRQGQRVLWDVNADGHATRVRIGSEVDMGAPATPPGEIPT